MLCSKRRWCGNTVRMWRVLGYSQAFRVFWLKPSSETARLFTLWSQEQPCVMNDRAAKQHLHRRAALANCFFHLPACM